MTAEMKKAGINSVSLLFCLWVGGFHLNEMRVYQGPVHFIWRLISHRFDVLSGDFTRGLFK